MATKIATKSQLNNLLPPLEPYKYGVLGCCATILVPQERLELSRLSAPASKTGVSTIPPPGHGLGA